MKKAAFKYWKVAAALVVIFASGQGFGFVMGNRSAQHKGAASDHTTEAADWSREAIAKLTRQLDLTPQQISGITPVTEQAGEKVVRERERALFQIHLYLLAVHDDISPLLNETQGDALARSREKLRLTIESRFSSFLKDPSDLERPDATAP